MIYESVYKVSYNIKNVARVDDEGKYESYTIWNDNPESKYGYYKTTIQAMGWASVKEFLRHRKRFKAVTE